MSRASEEGLFVLSPTVEMLSVREFPETIRDRLGGNDDDYVISDRTARIGSQLIGRDAALFLRRFREPIRIVDAVVAHSTEHGLDPHVVLTEAFAFIRAMCQGSVLITPNDLDRLDPPRLSAGDVLDDFTVIDVARRVGDTDVLQARRDDYGIVAVKRVSAEASQDVRDNLRREAEVLEFARTSGCVAVPRLLGQDLERDDPLIWMEWLHGQTLFEILRAEGPSKTTRRSIVRSMIERYAEMHRHGIYHGDVHPNNVMVAEDGSVRLFDLGGARVRGRPFAGDRIGLVQFYEPELAQAILAGLEPTEPTDAGEQFGVAGLAFTTLIGSYPVALSLVTETALGQIVSAPPRAFHEFGVSWQPVEEVLSKALSKEPTDRFPTFAAFAGALLVALDSGDPISLGAIKEVPRARPRPRARLANVARDIVSMYGLAPDAIQSLDRGPKASLYAGGTGVALALLRVACLSGDAASLAAAELWIRWSKDLASDPLAFTDGSIGESVKTGKLSLFQSIAGVYAVEALIGSAIGDAVETGAAVNAFISVGERTGVALADFPIDATNGAASLLLGATLLLDVASGDRKAPLLALGERLAGIVTDQLNAPTPDNQFLGFAHGRAGAIFAVLRWAAASGDPVGGEGVRDHLDRLASSAVRGAGRSNWPIAFDDPSAASWTGWCHGSAGHLLLWTLAAEVLGDPRYIENALSAGRDIWHRRGSSGPSLCCGGSGEALALFNLAQATGSDIWVDRGRRLAEHAAAAAASLSRSQGLFRAALGVGLMAAESDNPYQSVWPVLESPL